jgi:Zn-dependent protease
MQPLFIHELFLPDFERVPIYAKAIWQPGQTNRVAPAILPPHLFVMDDLRQEMPPPPPPPPSWEPHYSEPPGTEPSLGQKLKKLLAPVGAVFLLALKFAAKLKFLVIPLLKFFPILLKTGGTMLLSMWAYAAAWGWRFAAGFVLLILVHECGHLLVARLFGLKVGVPVFIPFLGALIALKEAPRNAWVEAWVGIGGPLLGTAGAVVCEGLFVLTGNPLFRALAFSGFLLNLFNLAPIGMLDGGRVVTALSPWLWLVGAAVMGALLVLHPNFLVGLILVVSLPRLWFLFRTKSDEERRYFEVTPGRRLAMAGMYFGLIAFLLFGMVLTHIIV